MNREWIRVAGLVGLFSVVAFSQSARACITELTPEDVQTHIQNQRQGLYEIPSDRVEADYVIKVAYHVVRHDDRTGGIPMSQQSQALIDLQESLEGSGLYVQYSGRDYINSDYFYEIDSHAEADELRMLNVDPEAVNIYFVGDVMGDCGISSYTSSSVQGIIVTNSCVGLPTDHVTVPHLFGHYFDLYHTHETAFGAECPDGSDCETHGDLVCDTPADPNLEGQVNGLCQYVGTDQIDCNQFMQSYDPHTDNLMSFSRKSCRDRFTMDQKDRMVATYLNLRPELFTLPADLLPHTPTNWSGALVPRDADNSSIYSCLLPDTLVGGQDSTWLNLAVYNDSEDDAGFFAAQILLDGNPLDTLNWGGGD